jgi:cation-transporting ATPase E
MVVPKFQDFFQLKLVGTQMPWTAVGIAAVASVVIEVLWQVNKRRQARALATVAAA